jgi:hypothetical protein
MKHHTARRTAHGAHLLRHMGPVSVGRKRSQSSAPTISRKVRVATQAAYRTCTHSSTVQCTASKQSMTTWCCCIRQAAPRAGSTPPLGAHARARTRRCSVCAPATARTWLQLSLRPSARRSASACPASSRRGPLSAWHRLAAVKCAVSRTKRFGWCIDLRVAGHTHTSAGHSAGLAKAQRGRARADITTGRGGAGEGMSAAATAVARVHTTPATHLCSRSSTSGVMSEATCGPVPSTSCCSAFMLVSRHFQPSLPWRSWPLPAGRVAGRFQDSDCVCGVARRLRAGARARTHPLPLQATVQPCHAGHSQRTRHQWLVGRLQQHGQQVGAAGAAGLRTAPRRTTDRVAGRQEAAAEAAVRPAALTVTVLRARWRVWLCAVCACVRRQRG